MGRFTTIGTFGTDVRVGDGIVAVTAPGAATTSAAEAGGRVPTPATPPGDAQAPVTSTAPVTAVNRAICPDRMISTQVTYRESAFTFVTDLPIGHDLFPKVASVVRLRAAGGPD
ncbi:hypothetical protein GCM10023075_51000 [Streptosporangium album]